MKIKKVKNDSNQKNPKKVLVQGAITPEKIAQIIGNHQSKIGIGAHDIFLGQVRSDKIDSKEVKGIEYAAYDEMAEKIFHEIREDAFNKFDISCMHLYHSNGFVSVGEICLVVFVSSPHRKTAMDGCRFIVEEIKEKVPVFGKEIFEDDTYSWKVNK